MSPEFYASLAAVIPIIAYPIMPTHGIRCEFVLIATSLSNFAIQLLNLLCWYWDLGHTHFQPWVLPLVIVTFTLGFARVWSLDNPEAEHHPDEFLDLSYQSTFAVAYYAAGYVVSFMEPDPTVSVRNAACLLVLVIVGIYLQFVVLKGLGRAISALYCRLATRSVPGWFWLDGNEFGPLWSQVLAMLVTISAPVLLCSWAAGAAAPKSW
ncbi:hypothetical protein BR93DRAFT_921833 [Coniochaeta sp. PMI_546]|nr:hypothetical protein BR93DRAFT_921833 [Coniochaeta sp. PMI_546]